MEIIKKIRLYSRLEYLKKSRKSIAIRHTAFLFLKKIRHCVRHRRFLKCFFELIETFK